MKKMLLAMFLVLAIAVSAFAADPHSEADATATITNSGNSSATGGAGGTAYVAPGAVSPVISPVIAPVNNNLVGNGIGNFSPSAKIGDVKATVGNVSATTGPINNTVTNKDIGNVTIGGGFLSKTLSPEATATVNNKNTNVGIVAPEITNVNVNKPEFTNVNKIDNTDVNINKNVIERGAVQNRNSNRQNQDQSQKQKQQQGQIQGQSANNTQDQFGYVAPVQEVKIENPREYLGAPSVGPAELNFGQGKVDWNFANLLPKVGIPILGANEEVKEVLDTTANVPIKRLLPTALKMKKAQMPLGYNVRLIIVKAEAQKSWTSGGSVSGAGSYVGNAGSAGSASLVPSIGGTKAHDLYTLIIVKVM